jgi:hypothetical protein
VNNEQEEDMKDEDNESSDKSIEKEIYHISANVF